jgi:hypothetical protein
MPKLGVHQQNKAAEYAQNIERVAYEQSNNDMVGVARPFNALVLRDETRLGHLM